MADISDVLAAIASFATDACYPNGTGQPSITTRPITVAQGWPLPKDLDAAMAASPRQSIVTVFPMAGASVPAQITAEPFVVTPAVHGMTVTSITEDGVVTVGGAPNQSEYLTIIIDGARAYSAAAEQGGTAATLVAALAAQIAADYPDTSAGGSVLTIVGAHEVVARIGAPATMGEVVHRQKQNIVVTVWAPTPDDRTTIAKAVDVAIKTEIRLMMPDTTQALLSYSHTLVDDWSQNSGMYRRDIVFVAEYLTVRTYPGYEITSFTISRPEAALPTVL